MNYMNQLEESIVLWINNIQLTTHKIYAFDDLYDGRVLNQLLNAVDPTFFSLQTMKETFLSQQIDDGKIQILLLQLLEKIKQYRQLNETRNPEIVYVNVEDIVKYKNKSQLFLLFEQVLKVLLSSQLKKAIIEPILHLDENNQELLMHFLQKHLDEENNKQDQQDQDEWDNEGNQQQLLLKIDELETENLTLNQKNYEISEQLRDTQEQIRDIQQQYDQKEQECKQLQDERLRYAKLFEERAALHLELQEETKLKAKCLEQERTIASLEINMEDLRNKEKQLHSLKEEHDHLKVQHRKSVQFEQLYEKMKERRETEKEMFDKLKDRYEKEIQQLKEALLKKLNEMGEMKDKFLNLELELQQKQARIEKQQQQLQQQEHEFEEKKYQMEEMMQLIRNQDQKDVQHHDVSNIDAELKERLSSSKNDNVELDYYIKENHKLEQKIKELQSKLTELELEAENKTQKREQETNFIQEQQIKLIHEKLKQQTIQIDQLKKQNEELKKGQQARKITQVDYDISVLSLLNEALQFKVQEMKQPSTKAKD